MMPLFSRIPASARPQGPAPTMAISGVGLVIMLSQDQDLCLVFPWNGVGPQMKRMNVKPCQPQPRSPDLLCHSLIPWPDVAVNPICNASPKVGCPKKTRSPTRRVQVGGCRGVEIEREVDQNLGDLVGFSCGPGSGWRQGSGDRPPPVGLRTRHRRVAAS